jgi:hypothetical protein
MQINIKLTDANWILNPNNMDVQQIHHIPSTSAQNNISARTSEDPDSIIVGNHDESQGVVWTSLGPLPRWVPGPTTRWAPRTTRLALHGT